MPHEVETMMYAGKTPWHGLGTYVGDAPVTSAVALEKSGLDWEVYTAPVAAKLPLDAVSNKPEAVLINDLLSRTVDINNARAVIRKTDQSVLGLVSNRFKPIQNRAAFAFMDALVADGYVRYHTAGSLRGGRSVWMLAQVGREEILPGDPVDQFLFLYNTHDGSSALRCFFTTVRVVCANTAQIALNRADSGGEGARIMHMGSIEDHIEEARKILDIAHTLFADDAQFHKALAHIVMTESGMIDVLTALFPLPQGEVLNEADLDKIYATRQTIFDLASKGRGQDMPGVAMTAWALRNGLLEWINYVRGPRTSQGSRFYSSLIGDGATLMRKFNLLMREQLKWK